MKPDEEGGDPADPNVVSPRAKCLEPLPGEPCKSFEEWLERTDECVRRMATDENYRRKVSLWIS